MTDIQFEEEKQYQSSLATEQKPFLTRLVLATGIVATDRQEQYVLFGVVGVVLLITFYLWKSGGAQPLSPLEQGKAVDQSQFSQFNR